MGFLGNGSGLIVADLWGERSYRHERFTEVLGNGFFVGL